MTWFDWFVMESFCYSLFVDIVIMDIQRINNRNHARIFDSDGRSLIRKSSQHILKSKRMSTKKAKYKHVYCTDCIHFNADIYPEKIPPICVFCYPWDVPDSKSEE
ncbi:MAG: hypothetical protein WC554_00465 [Clostridia bacterium]